MSCCLLVSGPTDIFEQLYNSALKSVLLAPLSALIPPSVDVFGLMATNGIAALLAIFGYLYASFLLFVYHFQGECDLINGRSLIWVTTHYGDRLRTYVDVGYATTTI